MKKILSLSRLLVPLITALQCSVVGNTDSIWHHPLYLDNGGFWKQRIPCLVQNTSDFDLHGDPISVEVGEKAGELPLEGRMAESIRVTNASGDQLMYRINDPSGLQIERGPIPAGSKITVPLECDKGEAFRFYIYFDNDKAWAVGEYFYTHREILNGGFENAGPYGPLGWELEWPEEKRASSWTKSRPHSGTYSLEVSSDEAGTQSDFGAIQTNIHLMPGVAYELEAWFRTKNLEGDAGLKLTPANLKMAERDLKFDPIVLKADGQKKGWSKASVEFVAPENSNVLGMTTFIEGVGKFWIDDIKIVSKAGYELPIQIDKPEKLVVSEAGNISEWYGDPEKWPVRAAISIPNFTKDTLKDQPVYVNIEQLRNRLFNEINEDTLMQVTDGIKPIPYLEMGDAILFKQEIPKHSFKTFYLYFSGIGKASEIQKPNTYDNLSQITKNFVVNSEFEETNLVGWEKFGETDSNRIASDVEDGNALARIAYGASETGNQLHDIEVSHSDVDTAVGLKQSFEVKPGRSYFFSARVKSSDVLERTYTLRARFFDGKGKVSGDERSLQANPDMHQNYEWVYDSMVINAPADAQSVMIELLNTVKGEVWYDDVFFMEIGNGTTGAFAVERKAEEDIHELTVWQENTIVKVFPDDLPAQRMAKLTLSAAKNEVEPLQLVLRSPQEYKQLEVRVTPLEDGNGNRLEDIEIGKIGYVPVDYPSNFYRDFVTPFWRTKQAYGAIGSDGWTGWWPDPILPTSVFDLPANETTSAWIEISVPSEANTGDYSGSVSISYNGEIIEEIPLEMRVYDFTLPEHSTVSTFDLRFRNREMFGRNLTEQEYNMKVWKFMKEHRLGPEKIRPAPDFKVVDGKVTVDFTEYDKAAEVYFDELKFQSSYTPRIFRVFGWGHPPSEFMGEKPYPGEAPYHGVDRSKLRSEYVARYQSALGQYWEHMKEKGWADKIIMYMADEPHADHDMELQTKAICDMIHGVDPDIPIYISTWWYRPEFEGYVDLWGVSHRGGGWGHPVTVENLQQIKDNGGDVIFTTDGMVCIDTPYIGFERLIPYFCFKYGAREYENWAANWHTLDPYHYGWHTFHRQYSSEEVKYWMKYPNGAGNMIFPGPPVGVEHLVAAARLKQARDGIEDFEYMTLLRQLIERGDEKGADVGRAQAALDNALELVTIPCADGRYTTGYVSDPDAILEIRHEIALAIEALNEE